LDKLLIATGNQHKFEEMAPEMQEIGLEAVFPPRLGISLDRPETGKTYRENARIKADEGFDKSHLPSLSDDSGLEVDALDGAPGIYSSRWAGENAGAEEKNSLLLEKLSDVPPEKRTARYICEMVLVDSGGQKFATRGVCEGRIALEPRGESGFGYDPVFEVKEADWKTFGELPGRVKNWISHRALALNKMLSLIREEMTEGK